MDIIENTGIKNNFLVSLIGNRGAKVVPIVIPLFSGLYMFLLQIYIGIKYYNMTHYSLSKIHYLYMDDILHKIFVYRLVLPVAFFIMYLFPLVFFVRHYKDKLNIKFSYWMISYSWAIFYFFTISLDERWMKSVQYSWLH